MITSWLINNLRRAIEEKGIEAQILALPIVEAEVSFENWDVVLLGP